jgi:predicted regulator of Ras-like GTPase activity (Roadblock/LC7/MglB family)
MGFPKREAARELARLAAGLPGVRWLVLIGNNGLPRAGFPEFIAEPDRISAMGSAMHSLGERISGELQSGEFRYAVIGGALGTILAVVLDEQTVLAAGLHPDASMDAILAGLGASIEPLLRTIKISVVPAWLARKGVKDR